MADYCVPCSMTHFGKYYGDMSNLITKEEVDQGFGAQVCCECCGGILVDHEGNRISEFSDMCTCAEGYVS